jgi:hypothetical protein
LRISTSLILIAAATAINVSLWVRSRPTEVSAQSATNLQMRQCEIVQPPKGVPREPLPLSQIPNKAAAAAHPADPPDQPWLTTVRDSVLQASLMPKFSDKVIVAGVECKGSTCQVTGSTKADSKGEWQGNTAVADFMKTMNDGQIAGGDTHRSVVVNGVQTKADQKGMDFSLTVQQDDSRAMLNPCQSVLDTWNSMHPEDFANGPKPANAS